jgi:HSP20 family protein
MNALTRWNPWSDMNELHKRLSSILDLAHVRGNALPSDEENMTVPEWTPAVDIIEDDKEYLIKVELPEVQKDDVKVTVEGGTLTISGERNAEKESNTRKFHRMERYYGRFVRSFNIPDDAEDSKVNAEFKDGVLRVHLAKSERARPKQIEVKVD